MKAWLGTLALVLSLAAPSIVLAACPVVAPIDDRTVDELSLLTFTATATDADADPVTFELSGSVSGMAIDPSTGVFTWTPTAEQAGVYNIGVGAQDGSVECGDPAFEFFQITVNDVGGENQCPVLAAIGDRTVTEGQLLTFTATATDADADPLTFSLVNLVPAGAAIDPSTGVFTWTPTSDQGPGAFDVTIQVSDNAVTPCTDSEIIHVSVLDAAAENQCPVLDPIGDRTVTEGQLLTFTATATDADGDPITYSLINSIPTGAAIDPSTGVFTWTPASDQGPGGYDVTIQVADDAATPCMDSEIIHVSVLDAGGGENTPPVVEAPATQSVDEGQTLTFTVSATDADADTVDLSVDHLPFGVMFVDHGDNSATFTWTPDSNQSGTYTFVFTGNDRNGGTDTDTTVVTVNDVGGGGGDHETVAEMIGRYNPHRRELCFRIKQGDADFDLREAELGSIVLLFQGNSIDATRTHVAVDCDDCFECGDDDDDDGDRTGQRAAVGDDDGDDDGDDCDESECEASHLRACFTMSALHELYGDDVVAGLRESEIHGTLSDGTTFVATLGPKHLDDKPGNGNGNGDDHADNGDRGKKPLKLQVRPNPLNPKAEISFSLTRAGQVRVALYDLNGRLVRTILDENRAAGDHVVTWDGTSDRGHVASGVYFLKIQASQGEAMQRVTVLK